MLNANHEALERFKKLTDEESAILLIQQGKVYRLSTLLKRDGKSMDGTTLADSDPVALAPGAQLELRLPLLVNLHGHKQEYRSELLVTRLDDRRFQVVTLAPLVLNAADFGLAEGLESLRVLADLPAISLAVPVSAVLIFNAR